MFSPLGAISLLCVGSKNVIYKFDTMDKTWHLHVVVFLGV